MHTIMYFIYLLPIQHSEIKFNSLAENVRLQQFEPFYHHKYNCVRQKAQAENVQSMIHTLEHKHELGRGSSLNEGTRDKGGKWGV